MRGSWFNLKRRTAQRCKQLAITSAGSVKIKLLLLCCVGFTLVLLTSLASSFIGWSDLRASDDRFSDSRLVRLASFSVSRIRLLIPIRNLVSSSDSSSVRLTIICVESCLSFSVSIFIWKVLIKLSLLIDDSYHSIFPTLPVAIRLLHVLYRTLIEIMSVLIIEPCF